MANIQSQKKRMRQNPKREMRNKAVRSSLRTYVRQFRTALESGDLELAKHTMQKASRALDKAAAKGVIHANKAANHKSSMARSLHTTRVA